MACELKQESKKAIWRAAYFYIRNPVELMELVNGIFIFPYILANELVNQIKSNMARINEIHGHLIRATMKG